MKHALLATLIVGIFVVVAVAGLQLSPQVAQFESRAAENISSYAAATSVVPKQWQYVFISILGFGVAALTVTSLRRARIGLLVFGLVIELVAVAWICGLYHVFFQPFPSIIAAVLAFVIADRYTAITQRGRSATAHAFFTDRLSRDQLQRIVSGDHVELAKTLKRREHLVRFGASRGEERLVITRSPSAIAVHGSPSTVHGSEHGLNVAEDEIGWRFEHGRAGETFCPWNRSWE